MMENLNLMQNKFIRAYFVILNPVVGGDAGVSQKRRVMDAAADVQCSII